MGGLGGRGREGDVEAGGADVEAGGGAAAAAPRRRWAAAGVFARARAGEKKGGANDDSGAEEGPGDAAGAGAPPSARQRAQPLRASASAFVREALEDMLQEQRREKHPSSPESVARSSYSSKGSLLEAEAALLAHQGSGGSGNFGNFGADERGLSSFTRRASVRRMAAETSFSARTFWLELFYHQFFPLSVPLMAALEGGVRMAVSNRIFVVPLRASRGGGPTAVVFCALQFICCLGMWASWVMLVLAYTAFAGETAFGRGVRPMTLDVCITNVLWLLRNLVVATKYAYVPRVEYDVLRKRLLTREEHGLRMMGGGWRDPLQSRQVARELMLAAMRRRVIARASAGGFRVSSAGEVWWAQQLARLRRSRGDTMRESVGDSEVARLSDKTAGDDNQDALPSNNILNNGGSAMPRITEEVANGGVNSSGECDATDSVTEAERGRTKGSSECRLGRLRTPDVAESKAPVPLAGGAVGVSSPSPSSADDDDAALSNDCCEGPPSRKAFAQELLETFPLDPEDGLSAAFYTTATEWLNVGEAELADGYGLACSRGEQRLCAEADARDSMQDGTSFVPMRVIAAYIVHRATGSNERRARQMIAAERASALKRRSIADGPGDPIGTPQDSSGTDWMWLAIWINAVLGSLISPLWRLIGLDTRSGATWALSAILYPMSFFGLLSSVLFVVVAGIDFARRSRFSFQLNALLVSGTIGGDPPEQPIVMTSRRRDVMAGKGTRACCKRTARLRLSLEALEARLSVHWAYAESAQAWLAARQLLMDFGRMYIRYWARALAGASYSARASVCVCVRACVRALCARACGARTDSADAKRGTRDITGSRIKLFLYFYAAYVVALVAVIFGALIADNNCCDNTDGYLITQVIYHVVIFLALLARVAFAAGDYNDMNQRQLTSLAALRMALRQRLHRDRDMHRCERARAEASLDALGIAAEAVSADNAVNVLRVVGFASGYSLIAFLGAIVGAAAAIGAEQIYNSGSN